MTHDLETRRRRAHYRANHRGTKELDLILSRYADAHLDEMSEQQIADFETLLELPDPQLQHWLLAKERPSGTDIPSLIHAVRAFHGMA